MVVFDASILLALLQPDIYSPRHPDTKEPVDQFRQRIDYLVTQLEADFQKIVIPTPALSEILVRAGQAGPEYLDRFNSASVFRIVPFDQRAAVEVAAIIASAITAGDKRGGSDSSWAKVKVDYQIVAIAKVENISTIYSDDRDIYNFGQRNGLTVIRTAELPLPPVDPQGALELDENSVGEEDIPPIR